MKALKVGKAGAPKGSGQRLNEFEQERIRKILINEIPEQLKLPFALWTREAVRQLINNWALSQAMGVHSPEARTPSL